MSYELYIPQETPRRNLVTGRFMKGHEPANKGRSWGEWMPKRSQRRCAKGWRNLNLYRSRPDTAGRKRKKVVAVLDDGHWCVFSFIGAAAEWCDGRRENVRRCCRLNQSRRVKQHDWAKGQPKGTSRVNTDHRYKGVRFYYESDDAWTTKIRQQ